MYDSHKILNTICELSTSSGTKIDSKNRKFNLETMYSANISFDTKQSLEVSTKEIAVFRLFLILFSDSFIPLPSELIIYSKDTKLIEPHSNRIIWLNDKRLRYPTREKPTKQWVFVFLYSQSVTTPTQLLKVV